MGNSERIGKIERLLEQHLEYDHGDPSPCPHCGKDTVNPGYWFYHTATTAHNIAEGLGLDGSAIKDAIEEIIMDYPNATGSSTKDTRELAPAIKEAIYG